MNIINKKKNTDQEIYEKLHKNTLPLYIWGIGNVASEVYGRLRERNITIKGCFVDTKIDREASFYGYPVKKLETVLQEEKEIAVIMGHAQYHKMTELDNYGQIKAVFYLSNPFKNHEDISYDFYCAHKGEYQKIYELFQEEYSKDVMEAFLNARINGDIEALLKTFKGVNTFFKNEIFTLGKDETYIDIGAYNGDTLRKFCEAVDFSYNKIYAFEPDMKFYRQMEEYIAEKKLKNVSCFPIGLWNEKTVLTFAKDQQQSGHVAIEEQGLAERIEVDTLDNVLGLGECECTLIKLNILVGGSECLEGARKIIQNYHPKIVSTVGVTREQLLRIPLVLKEIAPEYKLYLRFNESMPSRLTLYAV